MNELTAENVNISEIMKIEGIHEKLDQFVEAMEENPVVKKLLEAAQSMEDVYQIAKEYVEVKLEDFKVIWDKTVAYFKEERAPLPDEAMEGVVGGSLASWWNRWKRVIAASCIMVSGAVCGAVFGACVGGPMGLFTGAFAGFLVGNACAHYYLQTEEEKEKK